MKTTVQKLYSTLHLNPSSFLKYRMKRYVKWRNQNDLKTQMLQLAMSSTTLRIRQKHASLQNYVNQATKCKTRKPVPWKQ